MTTGKSKSRQVVDALFSPVFKFFGKLAAAATPSKLLNRRGNKLPVDSATPTGRASVEMRDGRIVVTAHLVKTPEQKQSVERSADKSCDSCIDAEKISGGDSHTAGAMTLELR